MPPKLDQGFKIANWVVTGLLSVISLTGGLSAKMISSMADDIRELKTSMAQQNKQLTSRMTLIEKNQAKLAKAKRFTEPAIHWEYQ